LHLPVEPFTARDGAIYWLTIATSSPAFDAPIEDPRRNIAITYGMEKLEWCGYPMVKIFERYVHWFQQNSRTVRRTAGRADRRTDTARRQKSTA